MKARKQRYSLFFEEGKLYRVKEYTVFLTRVTGSVGIRKYTNIELTKGTIIMFVGKSMIRDESSFFVATRPAYIFLMDNGKICYGPDDGRSIYGIDDPDKFFEKVVSCQRKN